AGAIRDWSVPRDVAVAGELSLAGEVRPVTQAPQRRSEAKRLGYTRVIDERASTVSAALAAAKDRAPKPRARRTDDDIPEF
ncbi:MAG: DNA repair protein RadA, partial [Microbacterium gubbeenense]